MIDLSGYNAPAPGEVEFQLVPSGTYLAHITNLANVQSRGEKKVWQLMLHLTLKHHGERVPVRTYVGHTYADGNPLTFGRKRLFDLAQAAGCQLHAPQPGNGRTGPQLQPEALRDQLVEVTLKLVEDQGFAPKLELEASAPARKDAAGNYVDPQAAAAAADAAAPAADSAGLPADYGAGAPAAAASPPAGF